ncbi:MAG: 2-hydroxyacyl-CoA dehydratase family protein [Chloroflexota bacterium]
MSTVVENRLETPKKVKGLSDRFYEELREAHDHGEKVVWCLGPVPFIPMVAMNVRFVHLENYGARIAARRVAAPIHRIAEDWGLSKNACSYLRGAQGMSLCFAQNIPVPPEVEPYRLPKPDMVVCMNYCVSAVNLAETFARELRIPTLIIDGLYHFEDDARENYLPYARQNMKEYIAFLEENVGEPMNYDRLSEAVALLRQLAILRDSVVQHAKDIPAPFTAFEMLLSMGGGALWAGRPESIEYMTALKEEVEQRVKNKIAAIPNEKMRLMWDFIMVWPKVGYMAKLFASHGAAVVWAPYSQTAQAYNIETLDPANPVEALAWEVTFINTMRHIDHRIRSYVKAVEEFSIDGMVGHSPKTCRKIPISQPVYLEEVSKRTGVPYVIFEADHSDPDFYSPAAVDTRLVAFMEMIESRKARAKGGA